MALQRAPEHHPARRDQPRRRGLAAADRIRRRAPWVANGDRSQTYRRVDADLCLQAAAHRPQALQAGPHGSGTLYLVQAAVAVRHPQRRRFFYVFPNSESPEEVPDGYVVVGGADYNTYVEIYYTPNLVLQRLGAAYYNETLWRTVFPNGYEVLLAKQADLEDAR
jgi:hypothetical protein